MDAFEPGFETEKDRLIEFDIKASEYNISSLIYSPNDETEMFLYKFKRGN